MGESERLTFALTSFSCRKGRTQISFGPEPLPASARTSEGTASASPEAVRWVSALTKAACHSGWRAH
jgi:hypothetical protein